MIRPDITSPVASAAEGLGGTFIATKFGALLFPGLPITVPTATNTETDTIYVQGFNTFQFWWSASGAGQVSVAYGICHPAFPHAVVAYRTVIGPIATGLSNLITFGALGQTQLAFQGDLYTVITLRVAASGGGVQLNGAVLWAGVR